MRFHHFHRTRRLFVAPEPIGACGETVLQDGDVLRVYFLAHDPGGHLTDYSLNAH